MTLIPWTSVFVALAFTLHTVSAVLQPMNLGFVLKREIIIENVPRGLEYGFDPTTSAMMWAFVGPPTVTEPGQGDQALIPFVYNRDAQFYRRRNGEIRYSLNPQIPAQDTAIEIPELQTLGENTYLQVVDIGSSTGVVISKKLEGINDAASQGLLQLGIELNPNTRLSMNIETETGQAHAAFTIPIPPGVINRKRCITTVCEVVVGFAAGVGMGWTCRVATTDFVEGEISAGTQGIAIAIAIIAVWGIMDIVVRKNCGPQSATSTPSLAAGPRVENPV